MQKEKIKSIEHLKKLASDGCGCDCFILLKGYLRSSKHIFFDEDTKEFEIINMIDGSEQTLSETEIMDADYTNIGHALIKGGLYEERYVCHE